MVQAWINCHKCENRYNASCKLCPKCDALNPAFMSGPHVAGIPLEYRKRHWLIRNAGPVAAVIFGGILCAIVAILGILGYLAN